MYQALRDSGDSIGSTIVIAAAKEIAKITQVQQMKCTYLQQVVSMLKCNKIQASLVINLDQTGVNTASTRQWTMRKEESNRVDLAGLGDNHPITVTLAATLDGQFLPM